jgi:hypothetical protein
LGKKLLATMADVEDAGEMSPDARTKEKMAAGM